MKQFKRLVRSFERSPASNVDPKEFALNLTLDAFQEINYDISPVHVKDHHIIHSIYNALLECFRIEHYL